MTIKTEKCTKLYKNYFLWFLFFYLKRSACLTAIEHSKPGLEPEADTYLRQNLIDSQMVDLILNPKFAVFKKSIR
jgi:hypothetical protein